MQEEDLNIMAGTVSDPNTKSSAAQNVANLLRQSPTPSIFGNARDLSGTASSTSNMSREDKRPSPIPPRRVPSARSPKRLRTTESDNTIPNHAATDQNDPGLSPDTTEKPAFGNAFTRAPRRLDIYGLEVRSPQLGALENFWISLGCERAMLNAVPRTTKTVQAPQPDSNRDDEASLGTSEAELLEENAWVQSVIHEALPDVERYCKLRLLEEASVQENRDERLLNIETKVPLCGKADSESLRPIKKAPSLERILVTKNCSDVHPITNIERPARPRRACAPLKSYTQFFKKTNKRKPKECKENSNMKDAVGSALSAPQNGLDNTEGVGPNLSSRRTNEPRVEKKSKKKKSVKSPRNGSRL